MTIKILIFFYLTAKVLFLNLNTHQFQSIFCNVNILQNYPFYYFFNEKAHHVLSLL